MYKIVSLILVLVVAARSFDEDELISQVFGPDATQKTTQSPTPTDKITQSPTPVESIKTNEPCMLKDGSMGKCRPYYLCDKESEQKFEIDPVVSYETPGCENYLELCC